MMSSEVVQDTQAIELQGVQAAASGAVRGLWGRTSRDARPGTNELIITGLPPGTRFITIWMTEWVPPDGPHAGSAAFSTQSVQLFNDGTGCRVRYHLGHGSNLPAAYQGFYG